MLRRPYDYIAKRAIEWNQEGKHRRERPQHNWTHKNGRAGVETAHMARSKMSCAK